MIVPDHFAEMSSKFGGIINGSIYVLISELRVTSSFRQLFFCKMPRSPAKPGATGGLPGHEAQRYWLRRPSYSNARLEGVLCTSGPLVSPIERLRFCG